MRTVVFVCQHGAVKSVIAAAYLERLAEAAGADLRALARGTEPDPEISPVAAAGLTAAGLRVPGHAPRKPSVEELESAWRVVSFGAVSFDPVLPVPVERWDDVPAVADGFEAVRDAIVARLPALISELPTPEPVE